MAFINNASPGSEINILFQVYQFLYEHPKEYDFEMLKGYFAPENLAVGANPKLKLRETINFWLKDQQKLWSEDASGKYFLVAPPEKVTLDTVAHNVSKALMSARYDEFFKSESEGDLLKGVRAFAFLMTQNRFCVLETTLTAKSFSQLCGSLLPVSQLNGNEEKVFLDYCHFLGLAEFVEGELYVDPMRFVRGFLPDIFSVSKSLSMNDFISLLSGFAPVLDYGEFNNLVREEVGEPLENRFLSRSLSHALLRLETAGVIELQAISDDAEAYSLIPPSNVARPISKVTFVGGNV